MGNIVTDGQATRWLPRLRPAQLSVWLGSGLAGLLALFLIATSTAATAKAPSTVLDNLALYASRGQPIHYCPTGWQQRRPATRSTACMVIPDLTPFQNRASLLQDSEVLWVEFTSETLSLDELIRSWGRPQIEHDQAQRVSFRWNLATAGLSVWMFWGDPREIPATTSLVLEALDDSGSTGPN